MVNQTLRVLHVEDDFADAMLVQHAVCEAGDYDIAFEVAGTLKDAKRRLSKEQFDLVLLDLRLPDSLHPIETLESTRSCCGDTPVMVLSGSISIDDAHLPEDIRRLDKNRSFRGAQNEPPIELANMIRRAAEVEDVISL